jgi:hypothetical protein
MAIARRWPVLESRRVQLYARQLLSDSILSWASNYLRPSTYGSQTISSHKLQRNIGTRNQPILPN